RGGGQALRDGSARQLGAAEPGSLVAPCPRARALALGAGGGDAPGRRVLAPFGLPAGGDCPGWPLGGPDTSTGCPRVRLWRIPGRDRTGRRGDGRDGPVSDCS